MPKSQFEIQQLRDELSVEIGRDAPHIATMVFGESKNHPDVASVPNERLDQVYRQAYERNDREWLQGEARRDPEQFLKVAQRIGVQAVRAPAPLPSLPVPSGPPPMLPPPVAPPMPAPVALPVPGPVAMPMPPVGPAIGAPVPQPVLLGPNGQPLIPGGN